MAAGVATVVVVVVSADRQVGRHSVDNKIVINRQTKRIAGGGDGPFDSFDCQRFAEMRPPQHGSRFEDECEAL